jgi:membrane-bound lytic murein transglycosylase B
MQFIPTSWDVAGRDGDGDGTRNLQSLAGAVAAAGIYLCSGPGSLTDPQNAYRAVVRYNHSDAYARTVLSLADAAGLVRVLDPLTACTVCLLSEQVVTCPTGGLLG